MTSEADDQGQPGDHWQELLGSLGIKPAEDDSQPKPATPPAAGGTSSLPPQRASASARQAPPAPRRPQSDWGALATSLGLEVPVEPEAPPPQPVAAPVAAAPRVEPPSRPAEIRPESSRPSEPVERRRTAWDSPTEVEREPRRVEPAAPTASFDWRQPPLAAEPADVDEADEPRLEDLPGYIEPPTILDDSDTLTEMFELRDESESELESDDQQREPAVRRRRRRRGRRERPGEESPSGRGLDTTDEVLEGPPSQDDESSEFGEPAEAEAGPDREAEEGETGFRRRRRRRRRGSAAGGAGRSDDRRTAARDPSEAAGATDDDDDEPEPNWDELDDDDEDGSRGREGGGEPGAPKHRKIPTWEQAISVIVDANLQSRSRSGGSSRGGGGGGPRGRRRGRR